MLQFCTFLQPGRRNLHRRHGALHACSPALKLRHGPIAIFAYLIRPCPNRIAKLFPSLTQSPRPIVDQLTPRHLRPSLRRELSHQYFDTEKPDEQHCRVRTLGPNSDRNKWNATPNPGLADGCRSAPIVIMYWHAILPYELTCADTNRNMPGIQPG